MDSRKQGTRFNHYVDPSTKRVEIDALYTDLNAHMYYEDWSMNVLPVVLGSERGYEIHTDPPEAIETFSKLLTRSAYDHSRPEAENSLREFSTEVVQLLIAFGCAVYEPVRMNDNYFRLRSVPNEGLRIDKSVVTQVYAGEDGKRISVDVPREELLVFECPDWIEGKKGFRGVISNLIRETPRQSTPIKHFEAQMEGRSNYFDWNAYHRSHAVRVLRLTRASGWPVRTLFADKMSEFYFVSRVIKFRIEQANLRDYLLGTLREYCRKFKESAFSFTVTGLSSIESLRSLEEKLKRGEISFKKVMAASR